MRDRSKARLLFGDFEFDTESRTLFRNGWPVKVQPQPLRVLGALLQRPGETVSREVLRAEVWGESTFVEFDQGLNYSIRQIRLALLDGAVNPTYIETLPKQGYRFIAEVRQAAHMALACPPSNHKDAAEPEVIEEPKLPDRPLDPPVPSLALPSRSWPPRRTRVAVALVLTALSLVYVAHFRHVPSPPARYTQLTDFTNSAMAPTLSPDGRMVAFFRSDSSFLTSDEVYIKLLPNGAVKRLTNDNRFKYSLAFSPEGSQIAYTAVESDSMSTYTVSVLGGESHLLLKNAAGLSWLDQNQLLFSEMKSGLHMGIVTGTGTRQHFREIYFPLHERSMAHYSYPSPDRKKALVVEMNERGAWTNCRLISLDGAFPTRPAGPDGGCTSAAWSPDGSWMYFVAVLEGKSHLWRARYPGGQPEQITFGPTEENGVATEQNGRSVITSMGIHESTIWMHDSTNSRALLSEGEISSQWSVPSFSADGKQLYYLLRHPSEASEPELWRTDLASGVNEALFPGLHMRYYAVSPDDQRVLYATVVGVGEPQLWIAAIDGSYPARNIGQPNDRAPNFGPNGEILFEFTEGNFNYLGRMNQDGSGRSKVVPYPISFVIGISPSRRWIMAVIPVQPGDSRAPVAIPTAGGPPRRVCVSLCTPSWSLDGKALFVPVETPSNTSPGRSLVIPVGPGEDLAALPLEGIKPMAQASDVPGSRSIDRAYFVPGADLSHFAYVKTTAHYNLFRVQLP